MTYFRHDAPLATGQQIELRGEEAQHLLRSRRIRQGEQFALQDPTGQRFLAEMAGADRHVARAVVGARLPVPPLPGRAVTLLQAAVKDKAAEWIIEKATELGLVAVCFFPTEHSSVAHAALAHPRQQARWERIAWEACKQCDRQFPPAVQVLPDLASALTAHPTGPAAAGWVLHPGGRREAAKALPPAAPDDGQQAPPALRVLVGPEGGLTPMEVSTAQAAGYEAVRLGGTILRAETAALAASALAVLA